MVAAFTLTSTLMISNLSAVASEYINCEKEIINQIENKSKIIENKKDLDLLISYLEKSYEEFDLKVMNHLFQNNQELVRENKTTLVGTNLALVASHIDYKNKIYNEAIKFFRKDKEFQSYKIKFNQLVETNNDMKEKIQRLIDLTFMEMEAKNSFKALQLLAFAKNKEFVLDSYWYNVEFDRKDKPLFIASKYVENIDIDQIYEIENSFSEFLKENAIFKSNIPDNILQNVNIYNFNSLKKSIFTRVSFI